MNVLSKNAEDIQNALSYKGMNCQVMELNESTRTAQDAATSLSCSVAQIVKSLIFKTKNTNEPVLLLVSGLNRVDEKIISEHLGEKIEKADADFTREVTGFAIGGIPPIGHKNEIKHIFIDCDLMPHEYLWAAAGTPNAVFKIEKKNFPDIFQGKIISLKKED